MPQQVEAAWLSPGADDPKEEFAARRKARRTLGTGHCCHWFADGRSGRLTPMQQRSTQTTHASELTATARGEL